MKARAVRQGGFSLAEMMIAIAILGIGLLMAAAAFPTGMDQERIVTDLTMGPLVAEHAANLIRREIAAYFEALPQTLPGSPQTLVGSQEDHRERWTTLQAPGERAKRIPNGFLLPTFQQLFGDFSARFADPSGSDLYFAEKVIRTYPFGVPAARAKYSWSMLMRFVPGTELVHVVVLVSRGPVMIDPDDPGGQRPQYLKRFGPSGTTLSRDKAGIWRLRVPSQYFEGTGKAEGSLITEGSQIVDSVNSQIHELEALDEDSSDRNVRYYYLGRSFPEDWNGRNIRGWVLPTDPDRGRSTVIGVYQYYFPI